MCCDRTSIEPLTARPRPIPRPAVQLRAARRRVPALAMGLAAVLATGLLAGCKPAAQEWLDFETLVQDQPGSFDAFGMTFDNGASPQQVVWGLLKAIEQDIGAAPFSDERRDAIALQCRLADLRQVIDREKAEARGFSWKSLAFANSVAFWAPSLNHYLAYLPDDLAAFEQAVEMRQAQKPDSQQQMVRLSYALHSSGRGGPEGLNYGATIWWYVVKGQAGLWRVSAMRFGPSPDLPAKAPQTIAVPAGKPATATKQPPAEQP